MLVIPFWVRCCLQFSAIADLCFWFLYRGVSVRARVKLQIFGFLAVMLNRAVIWRGAVAGGASAGDDARVGRANGYSFVLNFVFTKSDKPLRVCIGTRPRGQPESRRPQSKGLITCGSGLPRPASRMTS